MNNKQAKKMCVVQKAKDSAIVVTADSSGICERIKNVIRLSSAHLRTIMSLQRFIKHTQAWSCLSITAGSNPFT